MINKLTSAIVISSLIYSLPSGAQSLSELPLMPWPQQVEVKNADGKWVLNNTLDIYVEGDDLGDATRRWRERIETQTGWQLTPHQANNTQAPIKVFIEKKYLNCHLYKWTKVIKSQQITMAPRSKRQPDLVQC